MSVPWYPLRLERSYHQRGFFDVPIAYDEYVRKDDGHVHLVLNGGQEIPGRVDRSANVNGTARVHGNSALPDWFQQNYVQGETITVTFESPQRLGLG